MAIILIIYSHENSNSFLSFAEVITFLLLYTTIYTTHAILLGPVAP